MAGRIQGNCAQEVAHTGRGNCEKIPGKIVALLITAYNARYPIDPQVFLDGLPGYVNTTDTLRITPVKPISGNEPTGGDIATSDLGNYGGSIATGVNPLSVNYQVETGSPCLYKELAKLNRRKVRVFQVDDEGYIFGTVMVDSQGNETFAGFDATLYAYKTDHTGTTPYQLFLRVDYSSLHESEERNMNAVNAGSHNIPDGLSGVILLDQQSAGAVKVVTSCGSEDMTPLYATEWGDTMFVNRSGGNPTTVTYNAATETLTLAPAADYRVANAEILSAGGIEGLEGDLEYTTVS